MNKKGDMTIFVAFDSAFLITYLGVNTNGNSKFNVKKFVSKYSNDNNYNYLVDSCNILGYSFNDVLDKYFKNKMNI